MGLFDSLFGGQKLVPAPKLKGEKPVVEPEVIAAASAGVNLEIVAAIAAGIAVMDDTSVSAELLAVITASVVHHSGGAHAVIIERTSNVWAMSGRQKLMDSRQTA